MRDIDDTLVKNKTKFFPDKSNNSEQNTLFEKLWSVNLKEKTTKNNLSLKQKQTFKNIQENGDIIIREADTGSDVVILDKMCYKTKIQEILKDETNYKLINTNIDNNISKITCLKELHTTLNQRGYPTTLINKGFELAEKIPQRIKEPEKGQWKTSSICCNLQEKWSSTVHRNHNKSKRT